MTARADDRGLELRLGPGRHGEFRGGLGRIIESAPTHGPEFGSSTMFDPASHPPKGRDGFAGKALPDDGP